MRAISLQRNKISGQLLIEAMIAVSVTIVGLLGIFSLLSRSLGLYKVVSDQYVAANLAAEGIEVTKNILDSNAIKPGVRWNEGFATDGDFGVQYSSESLDKSLASKNLLFNPINQIYSYEPDGSPTNFRRVVKIRNIPPDELQINSIVSWNGRGGFESNINLEDHFFNWR